MSRSLGIGLVVAAVVYMSGCALGPNFKTPEVQSPEVFRGGVPTEDAASMADLPWWQVFDDPVLQGLVNEAIQSNYDLQAATARMQQASYLVGVVRADLLPQVGYAGSGGRNESLLFFDGSPQRLTYNVFNGAFNLAWEIDVWGRVRRATEAADARAQVQVEDQRGILLMLVSKVAESYFRLLELDRSLAIAVETEASFKQSVELFQRRMEGGVGSELAVARAQASLSGVSAAVPQLEAQIVAAENGINVLLGRPPGPVARGRSLVEQEFPDQSDAGLPSELLRRRPDVLLAEQEVRAANAEIGVAIADFFPSIGLTTLYGASNTQIEEIFKGNFSVWNVVGNVSGPIFTGGRNLERYRAQEAAWEASVASYQSTVLQAFREVSDTLTLQRKLVDIKAATENEVKALQKSVDLSFLRYELGLADYFEVLQAQQELYPAQLNLATAQLDQLLVVARLYRALGGGWNLTSEEWEKPEPTPIPDESGVTLTVVEIEETKRPAPRKKHRSPMRP